MPRAPKPPVAWTAPAASRTTSASADIEKLQDERNNERINLDSFRKRHAKQHGHEQFACGFRIATDRFHGLKTDETDCERRRQTANRHGKTLGQGRDGFCVHKINK